MLILLPPSEGKATPKRGASLDPSALSFDDLTPARTTLREALLRLCAGDPDVPLDLEALVDRAVAVLGLSAGQRNLIALNRDVENAPTARADRVYTGVLYDALGFDSLSTSAKRRANSRVAITSSLFGLVRPADRIPSYRLAGDVNLPGVGSVAGHWRENLGPAVLGALGRGLLVDLRSSTYAAFWRPDLDLSSRVATVRVLHEADGKRSVVSHFNKATKGRIVRALLEDGRDAKTPAQLAALLDDLGWAVEVDEPTSSATNRGTRLDVIVTQV